MNILNEFHFLRPWWLLALLIFVFGKNFFIGLKNSSSWEAVCDPKLLDFLLIKGSSKQRRFVNYLAIIGLLGGIIALSGPTWHKRHIPTYSPANPVMILLNLSSDMDNSDVTPNRLTRAKFGIDDFLKNIRAQVGLIVYTDEPYLISPITEDTQIISNLLPSIDRRIMPENGDKLNRAIDLATERLKESGYSYGNIVVFTSDIGQEFNAALSAAEKSARDGYKINVVGISTSDNEKLQMLASKGNGVYLNISSSINRLVQDINSQISSELQKNKNEQETWEDGGYWFLFIPLLCCLYFFRRGILVMLVFFTMTSNAVAGFFTNADQDGAKAFAKGDYTTAASTFNNSDWKAASLYRNGDYAAALKIYAQKDDVENMYNYGNALAKSGNIEEAIKQYEKVIKINPDHEDANFNLEYLKQQKNQNQSSQNQQQEKQQENQQDNQSENASQSDDNNQQSKQKDQTTSSDQEEQNQGNDNSDNNEQNSNQSPEKQTGDNSDSVSSPQSTDQTPRQHPSDDGTNSQQPVAEQAVPMGEEPDDKSDDASASAPTFSDEEGEFDEEAQAREMSYRNIPENPGGLLRAFIYKEYNKNRYGDK